MSSGWMLGTRVRSRAAVWVRAPALPSSRSARTPRAVRSPPGGSAASVAARRRHRRPTRTISRPEDANAGAEGETTRAPGSRSSHAPTARCIRPPPSSKQSFVAHFMWSTFLACSPRHRASVPSWFHHYPCRTPPRLTSAEEVGSGGKTCNRVGGGCVHEAARRTSAAAEPRRGALVDTPRG